MESFATPYPVFFYDGDQEHDKGPIGIHSVLNFKKFQAQLSRLVGVPANQLSTVLVYRKGNKESDKKQKLPIGETTNFNIILNQHNPTKERSCHFLVSIKRSKKERKGTRKRTAEAGEDDDTTSSRGDVSPQDQRPNQEVYSESTSPTSILQRPISPGSPPDIVEDNSEATRKVLAGTTERLLMRRENSRVGASHRVEGFDPSSPSESPLSPQLDSRWSRGARDIKSSKQSTPPRFNDVVNPPVVSPVVTPSKLNSGTKASPAAVSPVTPPRFNDVVNTPDVSISAIRPPRVPASNRASTNVPPTGTIASAGVVEQHSVEQEARRNARYECQFCRENPLEFHHCLNDEILVKPRRVPLPPIARPRRVT